MSTDEAGVVRRAIVIVLLLVALRLLVAAATPLAFDEAYYWLWSQHIAGGFYDHPPAVAVVIRLGTMLAGDSELGVRLISVLLALPMTWAVYRTAEILFDNRRVAASAAIFLNLTLMVAAGTLIVTPDAPLMAASALLLYFLAKVLATGQGAWWLAVGVAAGLALLSKYTALFLGASIVLWLVIVPELRRWFMTPWPYLGGIVAFALFSPVIVWNAEHGWASFIKQLGRARVDDFTLRYVTEVLPAQIGLATPPIFALGAAGLLAMLYGRGGTRPARILLGTMVWPIFLYFMWHSLHQRVQGDWLGPVYPAFAIVAAVAAEDMNWQGFSLRVVDISRRWAIATGVALFALAAVQANFGLIPLGRRDPTAHLLAVGWRGLAADIDAIRARLDAKCIITTSYAVTAWLAYYLPPGTPVVQINQRIRWVNMPEPPSSLLAGRVLYVAGPDGRNRGADLVRARYRRVEPVAELTRMRRGTAVDTYHVDLAETLQGDALDRP
jgi:4-amino-4-deoxy-L-arabinose transferase-like glycosyltransferase